MWKDTLYVELRLTTTKGQIIEYYSFKLIMTGYS